MAKKQLKKVGSDLIKANTIVGLGEKALDFVENLSENNKQKKIAEINKNAEVKKEIISKLNTKEDLDKYMKYEEEMEDKRFKKTVVKCGTAVAVVGTVVVGGVYCFCKKGTSLFTKNKSNEKIQDINNFDCIEDSNIYEIDMFEGMNDFDIN